MINYTPLVLSKPDNECCMLHHSVIKPAPLGKATPALELMTDFRQTPLIMVSSITQIDQALKQMIYSGVRLLFVINEHSAISGIITANDIQGEKPMLYLQARDCQLNTCTRDEITTADIMTPVQQWQILDYSQLAHAKIGHIIETFKAMAKRHIIVMESGNNKQVVRGLFSASAIEHALEQPIDIADTAQSFAEIERALAR